MAVSIVEQNIELLEAAYLAETEQSIPFDYGRLEEHFLSKVPPRYLWLHAGGTHENPGRIRQTVNGIPPRDVRSTDETEAVPLSWAWEKLEIRCWGRDTLEADTLWRNICALLVKEIANSVRLDNFYWYTEQQPNSSFFTEGHIKVQIVSWRMIVPDELAPLVEVDGFDHTGVIDADDGCQVVSP